MSFFRYVGICLVILAIASSPSTYSSSHDQRRHSASRNKCRTTRRRTVRRPAYAGSSRPSANRNWRASRNPHTGPGTGSGTDHLFRAAARHAAAGRLRTGKIGRPDLHRVQEPNWAAPWIFDLPHRASGTGFLIDGNRIMTNAHVVAWTKQLVVRKLSRSEALFRQGRIRRARHRSRRASRSTIPSISTRA